MRNRFMPLDALKYSKKGDRIVPFFMKNDAETNRKLQETAQYYGMMSGKKMADFNAGSLVDIMGDLKLGRSVQEIMGHFYCFKSPDFKEIFSTAELEILEKMGINSAEKLRLKLFEFLNLKYGGFAPEGERSKAIGEFKNLAGLTSDVERALWIDREDEKVLKKTEELKDFVRQYNMSALGALFLNSGYINVTLPKLDGKTLRKIYFACKYNGVLCDILLEDGRYILDISGPLEIFGRPEKYGYNLGLAAFRIFRILDGKVYSFCSEVFIKNRKYTFSMDSEDIRNIIGSGEANKEDRPEFDSAAEEQFYDFFGQGKLSWSIEREPEPIVTNDFVYVPDFAYTRGKSKVYVEIMGYFTEHYQKKKIEKLRRLNGLDVPMIIIANGGYEDIVKKEIESVGYPVVYFKGKDMPYGAVLRVLEEKFSGFHERMNEIETGKGEIIIDVEKELERTGFIPDVVLLQKLRCYSDDEFEKCRTMLGCVKGTYIRGAGLFTPEKLDALKAIADDAFFKKTDRGYLADKFNETGVDIVEPVIAHFGYAVRWRGLGKTEIIRQNSA